nr:MAG TPA: hypothetical protein [Caudoviricetes sp.]
MSKISLDYHFPNVGGGKSAGFSLIRQVDIMEL